MTAQDLSERYGAARPWRRRGLQAGVALLAVVSLTWLGWTAWSHSTPTVRSELVRYDVRDTHSADAVVEVRVEDDARDVQCLLRAVAEDHQVVGEWSFPVEPGTSGTVAQTVRTERRATSVELLGCTAEGQRRPR